jgi:hypothetical protein
MNRIVAPPLEPREGAEVLRQADHRRLPENRNLDAWQREREVGTLALGGVATA